MNDGSKAIIEFGCLSVVWLLYCRYLATRQSRTWGAGDCFDLVAVAIFCFQVIVSGKQEESLQTTRSIIAVVGVINVVAALLKGQIVRDLMKRWL